MTPDQMLDVLRRAMKDRAPEVYREMKAEDMLEAHLLQVTKQAMDWLGEVKGRLADKVMDPASPHYGATHQEQEANLNMAIKMHEEVALEEAIQDIEAMAREKLRLKEVKSLTFEQIETMSLSEVDRLGWDDVLSRLREIEEEP